MDKPFVEPCSVSNHPMRGDQSHHNIGHSTEAYRQLKNLIEKNVKNGELIHYVIGREGSGKRQKDANQKRRRDQ